MDLVNFLIIPVLELMGPVQLILKLDDRHVALAPEKSAKLKFRVFN